MNYLTEKRKASKKDLLQIAQKTKNDEFYTRYKDIEKEVKMYDKEVWNDKIIYCNCDNAIDIEERNASAFALYFLNNFKKLNLKKIIYTHYNNEINLFNQSLKKIYVYARIFTKNGFNEIKKYPKDYAGSFNDPLSIKILNKDIDIVCTNPPFSKSKDYWKIIIKSNKKFLIISNIANVLTTAYVPYFKDNKVWPGYNSVDKYLNNKQQTINAAGHWYTNFPITNRPKYKHLKIIPLKEIPTKYKRYDNSKILLVDNCYIPNDYEKPFAVSTRSILNGILEKGYKMLQNKEYYPYIKDKKKFARVLIQKACSKNISI